MKNIIQPADLSLDFFDIDTTSEKIKIKQLYNISTLRSLSKNPPLVYVDDTIKGFFILDNNDTTSVDDGLNVIVNSNNKRYKKQIGDFSFFVNLNGEDGFEIKSQDILDLSQGNGILLSISEDNKIHIGIDVSTESGNIIEFINGKLFAKIELTAQDLVSSDPGNIISMTQGKLFAALGTYVSNVSYSEQFGSLVIHYTNGISTPLYVNGIGNAFDRFKVSATVGQFFYVNTENPEVSFKGQGCVTASNSAEKSIEVIIAPNIDRFEVSSGNSLTTNIPEQSKLIAIYRNGMILMGGLDFTASQNNGFWVINFTDDFGKSIGAANRSESITITTLPSN